MAVCPKCGSENVSIQLVKVSKKKNFLIRLILFIPRLIIFFFSIFLWFIIKILSLFFPFLRSKKEVLRKFAVCQNCGYSWKTKNKDLKA